MSTCFTQIGQYVSGYLRMLQDKLQDSVPKAIVHKVCWTRCCTFP